MAIISLKDFYSWYTHDEYVEVPDEVAAELIADKRYQKAQERKMYRYKAQYSLDVDNGIEAAVVVHSTNNPEAIFEMMDNHCRLCQALNSLPEIQGRRIDAHYLIGKSQAEIAKVEGVTKGAVHISIIRGLAAMKKYLNNCDKAAIPAPENCQC